MINTKIKTSDLLGKEFQYLGRGPHYYDCYGLVKEASRRAGIELPEYRTFIDVQLRHDYIIEKTTNDFIELEKPEPYCMVFFSIKPPYVTHTGLVLEDCKKFIHIMRKRRVAIEKLDNPYFIKRFAGYYKFIGENSE